MSTKHIPDPTKGLKHFSRHTDVCPYPPSGSHNYENHQVGPLDPDASSFPKTGFGRHHILPVSSVGKFETFDKYNEEQRDLIRKAYKDTKWCTSRGENLIVLPLKRTYRDTTDADLKGLDLPCHDLDHLCAQGYNDGVTVSVEVKIWTKFRKAAASGHPSGADVLNDLIKLEDDFRKKLYHRGHRKGGTANAIVALSQNGKNADDIRENESWLPFSMAADRVARLRPLLCLGTAPKWLGEKLRSRYARKK